MAPLPKLFRHCVAAVAALAIASAAKAEPAMWVIKDDDSTIYLLGTIHILRPNTVWQTPRIKSAIAESTELWLELAGADAETASLLGKYGLDAKKPLSARLKPEQKERVLKTAERYSFPPHLLEPMKPWYAAMTLTMLPLFKAGYNPNAGVEMILTVQAKAEGDKLVGLETAEEQLQMMNGLSEADQVALLMQTVGDIEEGLAEIEKLIEAWNEGDTNHLAQEFVTEMKREAPSLYQRIFVARNQRWSEQIAGLLKGSGVQFIAVGAGHLVGPDSVQQLLLKKGIKAERY